ncbi:MAG: hypothetical protein Q9160_005662 [Pyrenula sp. 1 TL-2023]
MLVELLDTVTVEGGAPVVALLLGEADAVPETDVVTVVSRVELIIEVTVRGTLLETATEVSDEELDKATVEFNDIAVDRPEEANEPLLLGGSLINIVDPVPLKEEAVTVVLFPEVSVTPVDGAPVVSTEGSGPLGDEVVPTVALPKEMVMTDVLTTDSDEAEPETGAVVILRETLDSTDDVDKVSEEVLTGLAKVGFDAEDDSRLDSPVDTNTEVARTELDAPEEVLGIELVSLIAEVVPAVPLTADKEERDANEEADARLRDCVSMSVVVTVNVEKMEVVAEVGSRLSDTITVVGTPVPLDIIDTELSVAATPVDAFDTEENPEIVPSEDSVVLGLEIVSEDKVVAGEDVLIPVKLAVKPDVTITVAVTVVLSEVTVWFSVAVILRPL